MKPSLPQGTRDFTASVVKKRLYITNTIKKVFELYGFEPLETPAMENLETLMGKYGEEGDKLIFKILNNGLDNEAKAEKTKQGFENILQGKSSVAITERALKYDLTIPFARYVAMNYGQLTFPYKRYQIQPVWRADRPQKGRYREFYQCDADVVGSKSLLNEIELVHIYATVFDQLGIKVAVKINSRKLLAALAQICGGQEKMTDITVAIDKLDKIGIQKVKEELSNNNLTQNQIETIVTYLSIQGTNEEKLAKIKTLFSTSDTGKQGIDEIEYIIDYNKNDDNINSKIELDFTLARGLNYYTGVIFEIKALNAQMGSIGGGGRYDDLTSLFGVPNIAGVGISFGVDRIYDVMEELNLFPTSVVNATKVLCFNLGEMESKKAFNAAQILRKKGIACEVFGETTKLDKQFKYADKKSIQFALIIGSKELQENTFLLKNLSSGVQESHDFIALENLNF